MEVGDHDARLGGEALVDAIALVEIDVDVGDRAVEPLQERCDGEGDR